MATSTTSSKGKRPLLNAEKTKVRDIVASYYEQYIPQYFASTLGTVPDIQKILLGLCYKESSFNPQARHQTLGVVKGAKSFSSFISKSWFSSKIQAFLKTASGQQASNLEGIKRGWGISAVMGAHIVRGADPGGKTLLERYRPDLAGIVTVAPGESIAAKYEAGDNGIGGLKVATLAGLLILDEAYSRCKQVPTAGGKMWITGGNWKYGSRIEAAIGGYLGEGSKDVATGTTPLDYATSIVRGSAYTTANGGDVSTVSVDTNYTVEQSKNGPPVNVLTGRNKHITGC